MKIFVIGRTGCGKSPLAARLAARTGAGVVSGSEWVRRRFEGPVPEAKEERRRALTAFSLEELRREPYACVQHIESKYDLARGDWVIEGFRSLHDLVHLFDPRSDVVIHLAWTRSPHPPSDFEDGISLIEAYLAHLQKLGLLETGRHIEASFDSFEPASRGVVGFDDVMEAVTTQVEALLRERRREAARHRPRAITGAAGAVPLPAPLRAHVRAEYLHDMDPAFEGKLVAAQITAAESYVGSIPTFSVLLETGAAFSYLPPFAFVLSPGEGPADDASAAIDDHDLSPFECPTDYLAVTRYPLLAAQPHARVFSPRASRFFRGVYMATMDWFTGNYLAHLIALDNGQLAVAPQHKVLFGVGPEDALPAYRKLRQSWHLDRPR